MRKLLARFRSWQARGDWLAMYRQATRVEWGSWRAAPDGRGIVPYDPDPDMPVIGDSWPF